MTNDERIRAFQMRLEGARWAAIGRALGYSSGTIREDLKNCILAPPRQVNCAYPALRRYITCQCGGNVRTFAAACKVAPSTMYGVLSGRTEPKQETVQAILEETSLSYAAAFRREED